MKIRRKYNNWIPQLFNVGAITLYPYILFARTVQGIKTYRKNPEYLFKHEYIHIEQVRRVGWFKFYFTYIVESFKNDYLDISYEVEAYNRQEEVMTDEEYKAYEEDFLQWD